MLGGHLPGTPVHIFTIYMAPPYVLSLGLSSHLPVRSAGQALAPFDRGTVLPLLGTTYRTGIQLCDLKLSTLLTASHPCQRWERWGQCLSDMESSEETSLLSSHQAKWGPCLFSWPHSSRVLWREKELMESKGMKKQKTRGF